MASPNARVKLCLPDLSPWSYWPGDAVWPTPRLDSGFWTSFVAEIVLLLVGHRELLVPSLSKLRRPALGSATPPA